jgi:hypothetical protein
MPAPFQAPVSYSGQRRRLSGAGFFYLRAHPTNPLGRMGNGTEEGHSKLRVMRLLRVTSKLAMLQFGNDIWRRRRAAPR